MWILLNEEMIQVPKGTTLFSLRAERKPDADVIIFNGALVHGDTPLTEGDRVVLITRGEIPSREELLSFIYARHTPGVHEKLETAIVGIAGVGGLGSHVAIALVRMGLGRLVIADFDVVEPSNLNRQQYFVDQIGLPKVQALQETLARINPYVSVETHALRLTPQNVPRVFQDAQVLVEAVDRAEEKALLVQSFLAVYPDRPVVMASGIAGYAPGEEIRVRRIGKNLFVVGDLTHASRPGIGLMAPRVGLAAHMQANLVVRLLLGVVKEGGT